MQESRFNKHRTNCNIVSVKGKGVFSCQAVSGPDDGKVELLIKVAERFDISNI